MKVKICGVKTEEVAIHVAKQEADFIGLVFVENVRRMISVDQGRKIVDSLKKSFNESPLVVGLFQNQSYLYIESVVKKSKLDLVQICGENDNFQGLSVPSIRQIRIMTDDSTQQIQDKVLSALEIHSFVILDSYDYKKPGGTGKVFDWRKILDFNSYENIFIAGGLNSENVNSMISLVKPWGVDISSGVETKGEKDLQKISNFINIVKDSENFNS
tara:strand:- start:3810 stop:4454 length:645 start_codon:yes stop_codon:yes gene_type:complete